jgi:hypothetical protein
MTPPTTRRRLSRASACGCQLVAALLLFVGGIALLFNVQAVGWSIVAEERSFTLHQELMAALGGQPDPELQAEHPELHIVSFAVTGTPEDLRRAALPVQGWDAIVGVAAHGTGAIPGLREVVGWRAWLALRLEEGFRQDGIWRIFFFEDGVLVDSFLAAVGLDSPSFVMRRDG